MATTIKLKNGSGAPLAGDLVQGEPALDLTNKRLYTEDSGGSVIEVGTNPSTLTVTGDLAVDTNTLFVDASANAVGIGIDSPNAKLHILAGSSSSNDLTAIRLSNNGENGTNLDFYNAFGPQAQIRSTKLSSGASADEGVLVFSTATNSVLDEKMRIDSSGNLMVGTVTAGGANAVTLNSTGAVNAFGYSFTNNNGAALDTGIRRATTNTMVFDTASTERMRIDSSGKILIGDSASHTSDLLQIETPASGGGHGIQIRRNDSNTDQGVGSITFGNNAATDLASISAKTDGATDNGALLFNTSVSGGANTERMRIDASGNVGIGTSSPATKLAVSGGYISQTDGTRTLYLGSDGTGGLFGTITNHYLRFVTNNTERMRIDSSGNLLVAGTSFNANGSVCIGPIGTGTNGCTAVSASASATNIWRFYNPNGNVGTISISGSATTYATSSDYRLKENVVDLDNGIDRLKQIPVHRFNFLADPNTTVDGFIAHEVQDVVPEAITGAKDAVDDEGNPEYQGIDQSKLVPLLTAALQEAVTRIETLEAEVAALKGA